MEIITLTAENLAHEHICCAMSKNDCQVSSKKDWLLKQFKEGLVFKKGNIRGKCFIEYIPAEKAWVPIEADGYMYINCLWVSGKWKGQGNSNLLLQECIVDSKSKGKKGLVILSGNRKLPFLSDPRYLHYKGFQVADTANPYYKLMYYPFEKTYEKPQFKKCVKFPQVQKQGFVLYYTHQCPFTAKYVPLIERIAKTRGVPFETILIKTIEQAKSAPAPFTTYSLFYNGNFLTNTILSEKKFEQLITEKGF